jgi:hypothetical protein
LIPDTGKIHVVGTPSNLGLILEHITNFIGSDHQFIGSWLIFDILPGYFKTVQTFKA